jgi:hypothetical protein
MKSIKQSVVELLTFHRIGKRVFFDDYFKETAKLSALENSKLPRRTHIINYFVKFIEAKYYLEIGVRNPQKNFNKIECAHKFSVDPGVEFEDNPVGFKMTSDHFFEKLKSDQLKIKSQTKFDVIFIDGLHISDQAERDILNSIEYLSENGVIILHDCNPPSEFHQREQYGFKNSPATAFWNGTTWKAFYKARHRKDLFSICFDTDWGVAVISKKKYPLFNTIEDKMQNEFYEYSVLNNYREEHLNLNSFEQWAKQIEK